MSNTISPQCFTVAEDILRTTRREAFQQTTLESESCLSYEDEWEFEGHSLMVGIYSDENEVVYYEVDNEFFTSYPQARRELAQAAQVILDEVRS